MEMLDKIYREIRVNPRNLIEDIRVIRVTSRKPREDIRAIFETSVRRTYDVFVNTLYTNILIYYALE